MPIQQVYALIDRIKAAPPAARKAVLDALGAGLIDAPQEEMEARVDAALAFARVPSAEYASRAWDM